MRATGNIKVIDKAVGLKEKSTVLLRLDLNVPLDERGKDVADETRIEECVNTIEFLLSKNAKIVIISHFRRPGGTKVSLMSLQKVKCFLEKKINKEISFIEKIEEAKDKVSSLDFGSIAMLENLRFFPGEELNDDEFAKKLATIGDVYVNDAFSCSHRKHASVHAITKFIDSYAGLHLYKEVKALEGFFGAYDKRTNNKDKSNENIIKSAIIGGKKVSDKIEFINSMLGEMRYIMIGGAMANTFLVAQGHEIGNSFFEKDMVDRACNILSSASVKNKKTEIILPTDFYGLHNRKNNYIEVRSINHSSKDHSSKDRLPKDRSLKNFSIFDIGPRSIGIFVEKIRSSDYVFWNGPLGLYENTSFCIGTNAMCNAIRAHSLDGGALSMVGGGDTLHAIKKNFSTLNKSMYSHISTGGSALLEWIVNRTLPCIDVLRN